MFFYRIKMIHLYGDSHADYSFRNLSLPHVNHFEPSITMFRIGRDNKIINFNIHEINPNDIIVLVYGEIDCRCHIQRQIDLGRNEDDVIFELVNQYFETIKNNIITKPLQVVVVGIIPPTQKLEYEIIHGPITHEFPFLGTDKERARYTQKMNTLLEQMSHQDGYTYFNPYLYYTREDGTLKHELSDKIVHIQQNSIILEKFITLIQSFEMDSDY